MVRLLEFLRDTATSDDYAFLDDDRRAEAQKEFMSGVDCIVGCQIKAKDKLTVWCAQHDETTLAPANARSYELASLSGAESGGILIFLMKLEEPSPEIIRAIKAGAAWFEVTKI